MLACRDMVSRMWSMTYKLDDVIFLDQDVLYDEVNLYDKQSIRNCRSPGLSD